MRIGVHFRSVDPSEGGGFTFEDALMKEVLGRSDDHDYVFLGPPGPALDRLEAEGRATVEVPSGGAKRVALKAPDVPALAKKLASNPFQRVVPTTRLDRVVTSEGLDFLWCLGPDVPSMEVPFSMTVWDLQHRLQPFFPEVSSGGVWLQRERYYETRLRRAAYVVVGTEAGRGEVERFYAVPSNRILVLPHPTPAFPADLRNDDAVLSRYGLEAGYVFYPAQLWPHKNHIGLLYAFRMLIGNGFDQPLVLAGSDPSANRDHVEKVAASLGISNRLRFLDFVPRSELPALYRGALCLAYVSYFGPENLPPLEAFSLGCPVVAARVPGAEEQLGEAAALVDPGDHTAIAEAIARVRDDEHLRGALVAAGRERAVRATPASFAASMVEAIERFGSVRRNWGPTA